jgi:hypothetical protein
VAHESFDGALVVKSLGRETDETDRFRDVSHELRDANIAVGRIRSIFDPPRASQPGTLSVLVVGALRVEAGAIPGPGGQIAYLSITAFPCGPRLVPAGSPRSAGSAPAVLPGGMVYGCGARTASHLQTEDLVRSDRGRAGRPDSTGQVGVTLASRWARFAIVGLTGSGKSMTTSMRLVDPDSGAVLVDDVDLREVRRGGSRRWPLVAQPALTIPCGECHLGTTHDDESVRGPAGGAGAWTL